MALIVPPFFDFDFGNDWIVFAFSELSRQVFPVSKTVI
jgi:hypothetical protein